MSDPSHRPDAVSRLGLLTIGAVGLATWAVSHRYLGLFHDAGLYTLQAAARLYPDSLPADAFLKFGSQDRFTLFGPVYGALSRFAGIEPAAAALTLLFQISLVTAAWALARSVMPAGLATLGTVVFVAVPGYYGADQIFTCIEPFLTPRMGAEALVLGSLAAAFTDRRWLAGALTLAAVLLHPIMGMAGVCALACRSLGRNRPVLTCALSLVGLKALALAAYAMPLGEFGRFDADWLTLVRIRSPYLFLATWPLEDWARTAVSLVTLAAGLVTGTARAAIDTRVRELCIVTLVTAGSGLALTLFACDLLHLVLMTQVQPWRWQWLATAVAALVAPCLLRAHWQSGSAGRAAMLLLGAAWLFAANGYALTAAAGCAAALAALERFEAAEIRWIFWGSCGLFGIALAWRVASNFQFTEAYYLDPRLPLWLRQTASFAHDGAAPIALLAAVWWLARAPWRRPVLAASALVAAVGCGALLARTWASWTQQEFPRQRVAQFAAMRSLIPPQADVFWPESSLGVWLLLERPSYLSVLQTSGLVFSRRGSVEIARRATALSAAIDPAVFMDWNSGSAVTLSPSQLQRACDSGAFPYLVTAAALDRAALATVPAPSGPASKQLKLYLCRRPG